MNEKEFNTDWQLTRSRQDQEGETKLTNKAGTVGAGTRCWEPVVAGLSPSWRCSETRGLCSLLCSLWGDCFMMGSSREDAQP